MHQVSIEIQYTGLRPGVESSTKSSLISDNVDPDHPRIMKAHEASTLWWIVNELYILQNILSESDF